MKKPIVFSIISRESNGGKTTLIQNIVPIFKENGYSVMTIKYSCHDFEVDREGSDSFKHFNSGSDRTIIIGPNKFVVFEKTKERCQLEKILKMYKDVDLIILEGFRNVDIPTIEVIRELKGKEIYTYKKNLIAIVSDVLSFDVDIPVFNINNYKKVCEFIESYFLEGRVK